MILALPAMLFLSCWQTITSYASSGASYTVAAKNIGTNARLLTAAALMVDYMLNVAVGISAGIGALTSAAPSLQPWTLPLCLVVLAAVTLVNLRGARESGLAFALSTYLFVASLHTILTPGTWQARSGHPVPVVAPPPIAGDTGTLTLWLLLRAFAAGCTAMTGVEAVAMG